MFPNMISGEILKYIKNAIYCISLIILTSFFLSGCGAGGSSSGSSGGSSGKSVTISWDAPGTNEDGTPLTDLVGYNVYYGPSPGNYTQTIDIGNYTTVSIDLPSGTYYFVVTAYDTSGNESSYSNEVIKSL